MGAGLPRYVCRECGEVIVGGALTSLRHHELGLTSIRCLSHKAYIMLAKIKRRERKEEWGVYLGIIDFNTLANPGGWIWIVLNDFVVGLWKYLVGPRSTLQAKMWPIALLRNKKKEKKRNKKRGESDENPPDWLVHLGSVLDHHVLVDLEDDDLVGLRLLPPYRLEDRRLRTHGALHTCAIHHYHHEVVVLVQHWHSLRYS